jgi:hypothetical protein
LLFMAVCVLWVRSSAIGSRVTPVNWAVC